jgi:pimeloyl-ACP methyl ester carboxylesterase
MSGIVAREVGSGPPLLLVNGYAATGADWDPSFLEALSAHSRAILPDNPGVGGSEPGGQELSVEGMAAAMLGLLDSLGVERCAVAGWSMGGFVAQALARLAPARVEALVLLASDLGGPQAVAATPEAWARLTDHSGSPREQSSRLIGLLFPPGVAEGIDREFGDVVAEARAALPVDVLTEQERAMEDWHSQPRPGSDFEMPVLAAAGAEDEVIPAANSLQIAAASEHAWLARFAGAGHGLMAQEPQRLAALIGSFLGR